MPDIQQEEHHDSWLSGEAGPKILRNYFDASVEVSRWLVRIHCNVPTERTRSCSHEPQMALEIS
jgi:hypothetical protein